MFRERRSTISKYFYIFLDQPLRRCNQQSRDIFKSIKVRSQQPYFDTKCQATICAHKNDQIHSSQPNAKIMQILNLYFFHWWFASMAVFGHLIPLERVDGEKSLFCPIYNSSNNSAQLPFPYPRTTNVSLHFHQLSKHLFPSAIHLVCKNGNTKQWTWSNSNLDLLCKSSGLRILTIVDTTWYIE